MFSIDAMSPCFKKKHMRGTRKCRLDLGSKTICAAWHDPPRTRTWNLRLRRPTPYPLGQRAGSLLSHEVSKRDPVARRRKAATATSIVIMRNRRTVDKTWSHEEIRNFVTVAKPPWPNGQGVGPLIRRLWVRVPQGVSYFLCHGTRVLAVWLEPLPAWDVRKTSVFFAHIFSRCINSRSRHSDETPEARTPASLQLTHTWCCVGWTYCGNDWYQDDSCGIWTHAACASGTWVHPLRPLGQTVSAVHHCMMRTGKSIKWADKEFGALEKWMSLSSAAAVLSGESPCCVCVCMKMSLSYRITEYPMRLARTCKARTLSPNG